MRRLLLFGYVFVCVCFTQISRAQSPVKEFPDVSGAVYTMARSGDTLYVGGYISKVYEYNERSTNLARFNAATGVFWGGKSVAPFLPAMRCAVSDGHGGFYISSSSAINIGDSVRNKIAHIDSTGKVTAKFRNLFWSGSPDKLALQNNILYVAGTNNGIHDSTKCTFGSYANAISVFDNELLPNFPKVNGNVNTIISDTKGGWYLGGSFTQVGGINRTSAARIDSLGNVLAWNPQLAAGSILYELVLSDSGTIYMGGFFTQVGVQSRLNLAEVDTASGLATSWAPQPNTAVMSIAVKDSLVYIYGMFNSVNGQSRNRLAAIHRSTGSPTAFNPGLNSTSTPSAKLLIRDSLLFVGGKFSTIGGQARSCLASINLNTSLVTSWNPVFGTAEIRALACYGQRLYVAGAFSTINGVDRSGAASFDLTTMDLTPWAPLPNLPVSGLTFYDDKVLLCGVFNAINNLPRSGVALVDTITGLATDLDIFMLAQELKSIAVSGDKVYIGGAMVPVAGGKARGALAAIDVNTERVLNWNPGPLLYSAVTDMVTTDSVIYVSGNFTSIGGVSRDKLAAISAQTGAVTTWNPVYSTTNLPKILLGDSLLYVAGSNGVQAFNTSTAIQDVWNVGISGSGVYSMAIKDNLLYLGGVFDTVNGQPRKNLAAVDLISGAASSLNLPVDGSITVMTFKDSMVYLGGTFNLINGQSRNRLALVDVNNGLVSDWFPTYLTSSPTINSISFSGNTGCIAGTFNAIGGRTVANLAAINMRTNTVLPWKASVSGTVNTISLSGDKLYIGGNFNSVNGVGRNHIAAVNKYTGALDSLNLNADQQLLHIMIKDSIMYVTGKFATIGGLARDKFAAVNTTTGLVTSWNPPPYSGEIYTLHASDSLLYAGGSFAVINTVNRRNLVALKLSDASLTAWNPLVNQTVRNMDTSGGLLFVAGNFTAIGAVPRQRVAAIDMVTGMAKGWDGQADNQVSAMRISGNKMYASGTFLNIGGAARSNTACIRLDSAKATSWNIAESIVASGILVTDDKVIYGGNFTRFFDGLLKSGLMAYPVDTNSVPLPMKLLSFVAQKNGANKISLKWNTASEVNSSHFIVERSNDSKKFESIGRVKASGNSNTLIGYKADDYRNAGETRIYYRLRQVDLNGEEQLSPVISVGFDDEEKVAMYPNPSSGNVYFIHESANASECHIYDISGKEVKQFMLDQNGITAVDCSGLQQGVYFVKIGQTEGLKTLRLVITK